MLVSVAFCIIQDVQYRQRRNFFVLNKTVYIIEFNPSNNSLYHEIQVAPILDRLQSLNCKFYQHSAAILDKLCLKRNPQITTKYWRAPSQYLRKYKICDVFTCYLYYNLRQPFIYLNFQHFNVTLKAELSIIAFLLHSLD